MPIDPVCKMEVSVAERLPATTIMPKRCISAPSIACASLNATLRSTWMTCATKSG